MSTLISQGAAAAGKPAVICSSLVARTGTPINVHSQSPRSLELDPKRPFKNSGAVKYMECQKNHAAAIGGDAIDGCGEFMAGGKDGTLEALICSACNCHRNFHRKMHIAEAAFGVMIRRGGIVCGEEQKSEVMKKRFRTKFSQEQKDKMLGFAEKGGWKIQKMDDYEVRRFCQEIGIKRKVLKVWMHNNKYHLAKKTNAVAALTTSH